jgi:nucleoid-associated protein YgaU
MAILTGFGLSGSISATVVAAASATVIALGGFVGIQATQPAETETSSAVATTGSDPVDALKTINPPTTPELNDPSALASVGDDLGVSATVISGGVEAVALSQDPVVAETGLSEPAVALPAVPSPIFDIVRIDASGSALIAGKSLAGNQLDILAGGEVVATVTPDSKGNFVAFFDLISDGGPMQITLMMHTADGRQVASVETVLLTPAPLPIVDPQKAEILTAEVDGQGETAGLEAAELETAELNAALADVAPPVQTTPSIVIASSDGVSVLQSASSQPASQTNGNVTVDAITYDDQGEVHLTGRGRQDQFVRVYVNNKPIKTQTIGPDGIWTLDLPEVDAGVYTLRIDEIDADGAVTSRFETPFKKEFPATAAIQVASAASEAVTTDAASDGASDVTAKPKSRVLSVTVQPGSTLWALAKEKYGEGELYVRIYGANKSLIRNPDLIYPGQIFNLPD